MNNTYFYIEPYAHINYDNEKVVVYETLSGKSVRYFFGDEYLKSFVNHLVNNQSRSVCYDEYPYDSVKEFVEGCRNLNIGDIVSNHPPFAMPMKPKFMTSNDKLRSTKEMLFRVIPWVSNLVLYTDTEKKGTHEFLYQEKYTQALFPIFGSGEGLNKNKLKEQFGRIRFTRLKTISMVGNKFDAELLRFLTTEYPNVSFVFYSNVEQFVYTDFYNSTNYIKDVRLNLWVNPLSNIGIAKHIIEKCNKIGVECRLLSFVNKEKNISDKGDENKGVFFVPFYSGDNLSFFEHNVFLTEQDILAQNLTQQDILNNMSVNSNFFGELYFMPDNKIYANPNFSPVGKLGDDWHDILYNLLDSCWFKTRDMKPCSNCAFQYLCPPPSNYEIVIGKPNLCTVKP